MNVRPYILGVYYYIVERLLNSRFIAKLGQLGTHDETTGRINI